MKVNATITVTLTTQVEVDIPPKGFELWLEGKIPDPLADIYCTKLDEALPGFDAWDEIDVTDEDYKAVEEDE